MIYYIMKIKARRKYTSLQIYYLRMSHRNIKENDVLLLLHDIFLIIIKNIDIILNNHHFINDIINYNTKLINDMIMKFYDFDEMQLVNNHIFIIELIYILIKILYDIEINLILKELLFFIILIQMI